MFFNHVFHIGNRFDCILTSLLCQNEQLEDVCNKSCNIFNCSYGHQSHDGLACEGDQKRHETAHPKLSFPCQCKVITNLCNLTRLQCYFCSNRQRIALLTKFRKSPFFEHPFKQLKASEIECLKLAERFLSLFRFLVRVFVLLTRFANPIGRKNQTEQADFFDFSGFTIKVLELYKQWSDWVETRTHKMAKPCLHCPKR